ncbi:cytochrome c nitrite reductase small subunit [Bacteroidota bacterium]
MNRILKLLTPPPNWRLPVAVTSGILVGLIAYIFHISNAVSYLSDNPRTCINCHVMVPEFTTWERGSHGNVATCNDCHVPQDNVLRKFLFKTSDGIRHASIFTFGLEPQVIKIKDAGREVVQENCIRCHSNYLHPVSLRSINAKAIYEGIDQVCWDCHRETPHGRVHSLSSAPYVMHNE